MPTLAPVTSEVGTIAPTAVAVQVEGGSAIVCAVCGCLLQAVHAHAATPTDYVHFRGIPARDARGCSVPCLRAVHRIVLVGPPLPAMVVSRS